MAKKAQTLIVTIWVLLILTVLAISIGHRASMALRLSKYQRDKFKALCVARAGLSTAMLELEKDANAYDSLNEPWVNDENSFKKITAGGNANEFATVSYMTADGNGRGESVFGMVDEERKININLAPRELLIALLEEADLAASEEAADNILIWRGDLPDTNKIYSSLGYPAKGSKLSNIQELKLVKSVSEEDYQKIIPLATVSSGIDSIDLNTAGATVLHIYSRSIAKKIFPGNPAAEAAADSVAEKIIALRTQAGFFSAANAISIDLASAPPEESAIFNNLVNNAVYKSSNFSIEVTGNVGKIKSRIRAVYSRGQKRLLSLNEN